MFTTDNTEGQYTAAQLDALNARAAELMAEGWDEKNASDKAQNELDSEWF